MENENILKKLRKTMLTASHKGHDGNLQSAFSSLEIIWTLYDSVLNLTPDTVAAENHNRFVLSKGQSNLALLAVLSHKGFIPPEEMDTFCQYNSRVSMQADRTKFAGCVESSAGSLGHGFPIAVGMALAAKIKKSSEQIYVLAGDGEMNEGTMWEAAIFAASEKMDNLTLIVDDNGSISRLIDMGDMVQKLDAFGFYVKTVDGHDISALREALPGKKPGSPLAVIAKTKRGYGSKTLMEDRSWFHRWPTEDELRELLMEVDSF